MAKKPLTKIQLGTKMLKDSLDGVTHHQLIEKYNITDRTLVTNPIRFVMELLKQYGDLDGVYASGSEEYIQEHKEVIAAALKKTRLPKDTLGQQAHKYLIGKYGKKYPTKAKEVAASWDAIAGEFRWKGYHIRKSIMTWLAAEGYLVGSYLPNDQTTVFFDTLLDTLSKGINTEHLSITFDNQRRAYNDNNELVLDAHLKHDGRPFKRRLHIKLAQDYE